MHRKSSIVSGVLVVCGSAAMALAAWTSPFGTNITHLNDTTCNTEPCERACKICCAFFNGGPGDPKYLSCVANCVGLGPNC